MKENSQIIQRIKKLLNNEKSFKEAGSLEEAEAFAKGASKLLLEYNLDLDTVLNTNDTDEFKNWAYAEEVSYSDKQVSGHWRRDLVGVLTKHNLCGYTYYARRKSFQVYGKMENVDTVIWLYQYLSIGLLKVAQKAHRELNPVEKGMRTRSTFLFHFLAGAVTGIDMKLQAMKREHEKASEITALVLVNKAALKKYCDTQIGPLKTVKAKTRYVDRDVFNKGVEAGKAFSIGKPIETTKSDTKLIG